MLRNFFTLYTLIAFLLGAFLSGWVMSMTRGLRGKTATP